MPLATFLVTCLNDEGCHFFFEGPWAEGREAIFVSVKVRVAVHLQLEKNSFSHFQPMTLATFFVSCHQ